MAFKLRTKEAAGKRVAKDFKRLNTTERSLRGRLRLARTGPVITGSFAEGDDPEFTEVQRSEVGTADIRLVRMAATAGGVGTEPAHADSEDLARPTTDPTLASKQNLLLVAVIFSALVVAVLVVVVIGLLSRRSGAATAVVGRPRQQKGAGNAGG